MPGYLLPTSWEPVSSSLPPMVGSACLPRRLMARKLSDDLDARELSGVAFAEAPNAGAGSYADHSLARALGACAGDSLVLGLIPALAWPYWLVNVPLAILFGALWWRSGRMTAGVPHLREQAISPTVRSKKTGPGRLARAGRPSPRRGPGSVGAGVHRSLATGCFAGSLALVRQLLPPRWSARTGSLSCMRR